MADVARDESTRRVRPVSGVVALLLGIFASILYIKGYTFSTPGTVWLKLLHVAFMAGSLLWGLKTLIVGRQRTQSSVWMARLMPYRIEVTREGWLYFIIMVSVLLGALIGKSNLLLLVFGLLAGPFVLNGYIALTMLSRNQVTRRLAPRIMEGDWFSVDLTLANRRWWLGSWMMIVEDHWKHGSEHIYPLIVFTRVGPRQERTGRYQVRLYPRGRHVCGPVRLLTRFPLGLVERSYVMNCPGEILVYPSIGRLTPLWHSEQTDADELVQQARPRNGAYDDEFHRLREWRRGDSIRAIHWRTTARRNQLMVRENHQMRDRDLGLVVDLWLPANPTDAERARVELALSFATTIAVEHCQKSRESRIFVAVAGRFPQQWTGAAGPQSLPLMLDQFALAEAGAAADLGQLAAMCFEMRSSHVHRILISTRGVQHPQGTVVADLLSDSQRRGLPFRLALASPEALARYFDQTGAAAAPQLRNETSNVVHPAGSSI